MRPNTNTAIRITSTIFIYNLTIYDLLFTIYFNDSTLLYHHYSFGVKIRDYGGVKNAARRFALHGTLYRPTRHAVFGNAARCVFEAPLG